MKFNIESSDKQVKIFNSLSWKLQIWGIESTCGSLLAVRAVYLHHASLKISVYSAHQLKRYSAAGRKTFSYTDIVVRDLKG